MRQDGAGPPRVRTHPMPERTSAPAIEGHLVFDFTGLHRPDVQDLALILTARLRARPGDSVWVRSLPRHTAHVLAALGLAHLFRAYPSGKDVVH